MARHKHHKLSTINALLTLSSHSNSTDFMSREICEKRNMQITLCNQPIGDILKKDMGLSNKRSLVTINKANLDKETL